MNCDADAPGLRTPLPRLAKIGEGRPRAPISKSAPAKPPVGRQGPGALFCKHLKRLGFHWLRSSRFTDSTSQRSPGLSARINPGKGG